MIFSFNSQILLIIAFINRISGEAMQRSHFYIYKKMINFSQQYKKFFVLDFEATCDKHNSPSPQEIIEFPCLAIDGLDFRVLSKFHKYVRPVVHPELTSFCTHLTGISQDTVDRSEPFPVVLEEFKTWLKEHYDDAPDDHIFVTCGNWDLRTMLPNQCELSNVEIPSQIGKWINLKTAFFQSSNHYPRSLRDMSEYCHIKMDGRLHSGIDDCLNMVKVMERIAAKRKFVFLETDKL